MNRDLDIEIVRAPISNDESGISVSDSVVAPDDFYLGRLHYHYFYELELFLGSGGSYEINNTSFPLQAGALFLVTPADYHRCTAEGDEPLHYYNLQFPPSLLSERVNDALYSLPEPVALSLDEEEFAFFSDRLAELTDVYRDKATWREELLAREIESLCLHVLRRLPHHLERANHDEAIKRALIYIREHYRGPLTLSEVSAHVGLSECYFSSRFSSVMQMGFSDHVRLVRLNAAANLLRSTTLPVSQIAYETGFQSPAYFSACFRERFHSSPRAYRNDYT